MRLALSLSFLSPTNAIELPGANFFGLFNHKFISSIDQLPPKVLRASEYLNPEISALLFPKILHRLGPILLFPPALKPWQAEHFEETFFPASIDAIASNSSNDNLGFSFTGCFTAVSILASAISEIP